MISRTHTFCPGNAGVDIVPRDVSPADYLLERLGQAARRHLFRECPMAWLFFFGRYNPDGPLPLHMHASTTTA